MLGYLWHPLSKNGSIFYGGVGSDFGEVSIVGAILMTLRHHNCHVCRCFRLGHIDSKVQAPACKYHHSKRSERGTVPHV